MKNLIDTLLNWLDAVPKDKYQHFAVGAVLAAIFQIVPVCFGLPWWLALIASVTVVFAAAWVKEHEIDPAEDMKDIAATVAGGAVVWIVTLVILLFA